MIDRSSVTRAGHPQAPLVVVFADVVGKAILMVLLLLVFIDPTWGNLEGKAPTARAITYPMLAFAIPVWRLVRPSAAPYPWSADLLLTFTGFSDILGNRLDLYDRLVWFDDWMHFMNTALISAAVLLLTMPGVSGWRPLLERAVAVGMTAALAWEAFEYLSFVTKSAEHAMAYSDTIGDLTLGWLGAAVAAVAVGAGRRRHQSLAPAQFHTAQALIARKAG